MISNIGDNPQNIDDLDFRRKLAEVNDSVNALLEDARKAVGKRNFHFTFTFILCSM